MVLRLVFAGTPEVAVVSLRALLASRHEVAAVITRPDAPRGRGRHSAASPVALVAAEHGIPVLKPERIGDPGFLSDLRALAPDVCPVVAYGNLVPPGALEIPRSGWVNLHYSLLPAWRGAAPVQHAILAGDDITGATTFRLEAGMDTGPCFGFVTEKIGSRDTTGDLLARLSVSGSELLVRTLDSIDDGTGRPVSQSAEGVSRAPKLGSTEVRVDWSGPALSIDRLIRAADPAPGAWTVFRGDRVKLAPGPGPATRCIPPDGAPDPKPGRLVIRGERVWVGTGSHPLALGPVRPAGRKQMPARDWVRGLRCEDGESFE